MTATFSLSPIAFRACTGRELSIMVNTHVFESLDHVERLRGPAEVAADRVGDIVHQVFKNAVDTDLGRFPALQRECRVQLQGVVVQQVELLRDRIKEMIEIEKEPFTLDPRFQKHYEEALQQPAPQPETSVSLAAASKLLTSSSTKTDSIKDRTTTMINILRCYIKVLHDTFAESAAKRIRHAAISLVGSHAENALSTIVANFSGEKADALLEEAPDIREERKRLETTADILRKASSKVAEIA
eukprot:TRINITY_DN13954_c0_g1_i1.p1 TRINITY_DN13954_c0_g1~~TRINITY_DN13954_c0_g1_i1.p1  ORF type:complete len:243 (-),score=51.52 TRINITY_DN13954_c0_g1_i1:70-798(-)